MPARLTLRSITLTVAGSLFPFPIVASIHRATGGRKNGAPDPTSNATLTLVVLMSVRWSGEPSNGLVDVDQDCREAAILARYFLPKTGSVFGA